MSLTIFDAILGGVLTYLIGQFILKWLLEPIQEMRKTIGQIAHVLINRANVILNPGLPPLDSANKASEELRSLSSQLHSHLYLVPAYELTCRIFRTPTKAQLLLASRYLIGLSNSLHRSDPTAIENNSKRVERICDALRIFLPDEDRG